MREWTPAQERAISHRGGHVVCSAAAGAGKTAVLTERVVQRLADPRDPTDVDQLLVVTFTRAAASEMRRRISEAVRERAAASPRLWRQSWLLPRADITTLHGFCERTLRRHFAAADCDPVFSLLDPADAAAQRAECLERLIDGRYADGKSHGAFLDTVARYGGRRLDSALRPLVLRLHDFALSQEDPAGWIAAQADAVADPAFDLARQAAQRALRTACRRTEQALRLAEGTGGPDSYLPALQSDARMLAMLLAAADGPWDDFAFALRSAEFVRLAAAGRGDDQLAAERARHLRDATKAQVRALAAGPWGRAEPELAAEAAAVAAAVRPLLGLLSDLHTGYLAAKRRLNALDFSDLEHECLALLSGPAGPAVRRRYREVLVDESQDLSPVQDGLLSALCREAHLFSVGDARQSIYGFRLADPTRFLARARQYADGGAGVRVALPHNFRSRRAVIAGVNFLFNRLFAAQGSDVPREEAGPLLYGADYGEEDPPVELLLLEGDLEAEDATALEREAAAVAEVCAGWVGRARVRDGDGHRAARPGDIAVLLRAMSGVDALYTDALRALGLPCWAPSGGGRAASPEVETLLAWLSVLDNPRQDIPLAASLRGPFGGFSDADIAGMRLSAPQGDLWDGLGAAAQQREGPEGLAPRAQAWLAQLHHRRTTARRGAYGELVSTALGDTDYRAYVGGLATGEERLRNLAWAEERCRKAEGIPGMDLPRLIDFIRRGDSGETVAEGAAAAGDAVRLISVHGSKGLEFPLVVVAGLGRRFNLADRTGDILVHRGAGIGAKAVDLDRRLRWPTLRHAAVAERITADGRAEELRVLYVALTRARERLALVGTVRGLTERAAEWGAAGPDIDLDDGNCPLDWIGPVVAGHADVAGPLAALGGGAPPAAAPDPGGSRWMIAFRRGGQAERAEGEAGAADPSPPDAPVAAGPVVAPAAPEPEQAAVLAATAARLDAEAAWRYPFEAVATLQAKVTVGELRDAAAGDEEPPHPLDPGGGPAGTGPHTPPAGGGGGAQARPPARPGRGADDDGPTPAAVGSATHLVFRHLDPGSGGDIAAVQRCIADLVARALLEPWATEAIDAAAIARYLDRPLGRRWAAAHAGGVLRREVPFALRLPAAEVYGTGAGPAATEEWVLVQGVFDALLVEPEGLVLIDYKTDRVTGRRGLEEAAERHRVQLGLYARAAAAAWGRPVRETWLAFLSGGVDVQVPLAAPPQEV